MLLSVMSLLAADTPRMGGTWTLEPARSRSDFEPVAFLTIEQTKDRMRLAQTDQQGRGSHNFQADCVPDGGDHAVADADDETVSCRWEGTALVTEQTWKKNQQRRTARSVIDGTGNLIQEIRTTGPEGIKSARLVWIRKETTVPETSRPAPEAKPRQ